MLPTFDDTSVVEVTVNVGGAHAMHVDRHHSQGAALERRLQAMRTTVGVVIALACAMLPFPAKAETTPPCAVTATVNATSPSPVLPGEPVTLNLRISNPSSTSIQFFTPSEQTGSVRLLFSTESTPNEFRRYQGPKWGMLDVIESPKTLGARSFADVPLRVLHQVWREPFVFNAPGTYHAKITYGDSLACRQGLETPTFDIKVVAPKGDDLTVWNAVKSCTACAFFLHTGVVRSTQADRDAVALLRNLAKQYPKSRYSKLLRSQLNSLDEKSRGDHNDDGHSDQGKPPSGD